MSSDAPTQVRKLDVLVIGGAADGQLVRGVRGDATYFELSRPVHIKPLASSTQVDVETESEKTIYLLHVINVVNEGENRPRQIGLALPTGVSLSSGFGDMIKAYVRDFTKRAIDDGRIEVEKVVH